MILLSTNLPVKLQGGVVPSPKVTFIALALALAQVLALMFDSGPGEYWNLEKISRLLIEIELWFMAGGLPN